MLTAVIGSWKEKFSGPVANMCWIGKRLDPLILSSKTVFFKQRKEEDRAP